MIRGKNFLVLMDSCLEGHFSNADGMELVRLASSCLQYEPQDRPLIKSLLASLTSLQKDAAVLSLSFFFNFLCLCFLAFLFGKSAQSDL